MVYLLGHFLFYNSKGSDIIFIVISVIIALYISSELILIPGILVQTKSSKYITERMSNILKNIAALLISIVQIFIFFKETIIWILF